LLLNRQFPTGERSDFSPLISLLLEGDFKVAAMNDFVCAMGRLLPDVDEVHIFALRARLHRHFKQFAMALDLAQSAVEKASGTDHDRVMRNSKGTILLRFWSKRGETHAADGDAIMRGLYEESKAPEQRILTATTAATSLYARLQLTPGAVDEEASFAQRAIAEWLGRAEVNDINALLYPQTSRQIDVDQRIRA